MDTAQFTDVSECVEGLLCSVSQALDADGPVPESPADKRGLECKLCGLEVPSPRELVEHRRHNHIRSCTCLVCGKRSRSVSQTWRHIATHVAKMKSSEMVYLVKKTEQQCHVCHKMFPSKGKKNFHLEHVHKVSDSSVRTFLILTVQNLGFCDRSQQLISCRQLMVQNMYRTAY
jgi:tRNA U54 and U55 pseudouridine synthase Pus10